MLERVAKGALHWRLHPNGGQVACVAVPAEDASRLIDRGWIRIAGERAVINERLEDEPHNAALRITFDRPYPHPHP